MATAIGHPVDPPREHPGVERILAAGIEVFGSYGFAKATIQEIVSAAHVSKPLFYRHFKNKQEVFEAVIDRVFTEWRQALIDALGTGARTTAAALRIVFLTTLDYGRAHPLLSRLLTRDSQLLLSTTSDVWERACAALRDLIEGELREGVARGEVRPDLAVEHMADLLTEMNFAFANRQIHTGMALDPEHAAAIAACMLDGVTARTGA